jgi:hypothetical protein
MHAQTAMIENGFVHLPKAAPWLAAYLHELTVFPNGRHDDQVDSTAQLLDWFKRGAAPSSGAGIWELYRQRAEELRSREVAANRPVRLCVPRGVGAVQLLSGARRNVAGNGIVEMSQSMRHRCCWRGGFTPTRAVSCGTTGCVPQRGRFNASAIASARVASRRG